VILDWQFDFGSSLSIKALFPQLEFDKDKDFLNHDDDQLDVPGDGSISRSTS
jgi:hypothetical protein